MSIKDRKISEDPILDGIILQMSEEIPVIDKEADREIPGLVKREFSLSAPYRIGEIVAPARHEFSGRDFFYQWPAMTDDIAKLLTEQYMRQNNGKFTLDISEVNIAVYSRPKPSLDEGFPLNAFETRGMLYLIKE